MRRWIAGVLVPLALIAFVCSLSSASPTNWRINLNIKANILGERGHLTIGAWPSAVDGKDGGDVFQSPMGPPAPGTELVVYHPFTDITGQIASYGYRSDYRSPWYSGTKIWNNVIIRTKNGVAEETEITLTWEPGGIDPDMGDLTLPPGQYVLEDLTSGTQYDLSKPGEFSFQVGEGQQSAIIREMRISVTFNGTDSAPTSSQAVRIGDMTTTTLTGAPGVDHSGRAYAACSNGKLYRVEAGGSAAVIYQAGRQMAGQIKSRVVCYADSLLFTTIDGRLHRTNLDGVSFPGFPVQLPAATSISTPALDPTTSTIYVGSNAGIHRVSGEGVLLRSALTDLIISSPAVTGQDQVWCAASNGNLYVLSSDLATTRAIRSVGTPLNGSPCVDRESGTVCVCGGHSFSRFSATTFEPLASYTTESEVRGTPFVDLQKKVAYFASDGWKLHAVDILTGKSLDGYPILLSKQGLLAESGNVMEGMPLVKGDTLTLAPGSYDSALHVVDLRDRTEKVLSGGDAMLGATLSPDGSHIIATNQDGCTYFIQP